MRIVSKSIPLVLLSMISALSACGILWPINVQISPNKLFYVVDQQGQAVADVAVVVLLASNPFAVVSEKIKLVTNQAGQVQLKEKYQKIYQNPFRMHGVSYPFIKWCLFKPGYQTVSGEEKPPLWSEDLKVVMQLSSDQDLDCHHALEFET